MLRDVSAGNPLSRSTPLRTTLTHMEIEMMESDSECEPPRTLSLER